MTQQELDKMTIAELRSLAKEHAVRLRPSMKKKEIVAYLLEHLPARKKQEGTGAASGAKGKKTKVGSPKRPSLKSKAESKIEEKMEGHLGEGEVRDEKVFFSPPPFSEIPREYGTNQITALVRDPWWIYAYWEVTPNGMGEANRRVADSETRLTLRVYDTTKQADMSQFWDIEIFQRIGNWYIDVGQPNHTYLIDVGMRSRDGNFATIARSNVAHTPPDGPSAQLTEEWWTVLDDQRLAGVHSFDEGRRIDFAEIEKEAQASSEAGLFSLNVLRR